MLSKVGKIPLDALFSGSITNLPLSPESLLMEAEPTGIRHCRGHGAPILPSPSLSLLWSCSLELSEAGKAPGAPFLQGKCWEMSFPGWEWHTDRPTSPKPQGMLCDRITQVSLAEGEFGMTPSCPAAHTERSAEFHWGKWNIFILPNAVFNLCPKLQWDIKSDRICCYSLFLVFHQILLLNHSAVAMLRRYCREVTGPEHSKCLANEE